MESVASSVSLNQPWVVAGDFNVIAAAEEREGAAPANVQNMDEFNTSMFKCGLSAIDFNGSRFTWTNKSVWQCLDRALGNRLWSEAYPLSRVSHVARGRFDHSPLLIRCGGNKMGSSCFRFLNIWRCHPQFQEIVSEAWSKEFYGMGMVRFYNKLKTIRDKLKQWNREVFGNVSSKVVEAEQELKQRESEYNLIRDEESKIHLHEARARYNQVQSPSELHFEVPRVTQADNELIKRLPTMEEIHKVVFGMDIQSAPGPDGFGAGFFQNCWDIIKDDLIMAIQNFF
ncbi:uncharacterized protein [Coffea arabica]|uniref:Endonuclease/exonuclease/phosphatase domain-containing protein n=1 Tax=Coffea arabica TaxID=13443 RepID=A0ABM4UQX2_COFAR